MQKKIGNTQSKLAWKTVPTAGDLKELLVSAVNESERNFTLRYSPEKPRKYKGLYSIPNRTITLFPWIHQDDKALIASGLHELAHHVACSRGWRNGRDKGKVRCHHGREFKQALEEILARFNSVNSGRLEGHFLLNSEALATSPWFWSFYVKVSVMVPGPVVEQLQKTAKKPRPNVPFPLLSDFFRSK